MIETIYQELGCRTLEDKGRGSVISCQTPGSFASLCAEEFIRAAQAGVKQQGQAFIAIPGGRSPHSMFERLIDPEVSRRVPWDKTHIFLVDERCVPPDSDRSNYKQANELFFSKVPIPQPNIHRFLAELEPAEAVEKYEQEIVSIMGSEPKFDFVILGLGEDGHIASLFPHSPALKEDRRIATVNTMPATGEKRLTLTYPTLNRARKVLVLVSGAEKAAPFIKTMQEPLDPESYPAQAIHPIDGCLQWILDDNDVLTLLIHEIAHIGNDDVFSSHQCKLDEKR